MSAPLTQSPLTLSPLYTVSVPLTEGVVLWIYQKNGAGEVVLMDAKLFVLAYLWVE